MDPLPSPCLTQSPRTGPSAVPVATCPKWTDAEKEVLASVDAKAVVVVRDAAGKVISQSDITAA